MNKKIINFILHPFLFVLFPPLHLYSLNFTDFPAIVLLKPVIFLLVSTIIILFLLNKIFKDHYKSAVILSICYILLFSYWPIYIFFQTYGFKLFRLRYFLVLYFFSFVSIIILFIKIHLNFRNISNYFNMAGCIILLTIFVNLFGVLYTKWDDLMEKYPENLSVINVPKDRPLPTIYYIILDAYCSAKASKEILGFDNGQFINFLEEKGFYVASESHSNYAYTQFSISSSLNMEYLPKDKLSEELFLVKESIIHSKQILNNKALKLLKSIGYKYVDISIWKSKYREIEFDSWLMLMTPLAIPFIQNYYAGLLLKPYVLSSLEKLENLDYSGEPAFIYAHIMPPHFPYMFDEKGNTPAFFEKNETKLYVEQVKYVNERIKKIINKILSKAKTKPVIIIQGDHGPFNLTEDSEKNKILRMSILSAYYLPDNGNKNLYDAISPVNSFRVVFNKYFNTDYKLLPDKSYYQRNNKDKLYLINAFE